VVIIYSKNYSFISLLTWVGRYLMGQRITRSLKAHEEKILNKNPLREEAGAYSINRRTSARGVHMCYINGGPRVLRRLV